MLAVVLVGVVAVFWKRLALLLEFVVTFVGIFSLFTSFSCLLLFVVADVELLLFSISLLLPSTAGDILMAAASIIAFVADVVVVVVVAEDGAVEMGVAVVVDDG